MLEYRSESQMCWPGLARLLRGSFAKSVGILAGGTVVAQGIVVLASPLLTRIYTPNDFGLLGIYGSFVMLATSIATLRYELAIPLPKKSETAIALLYLALGAVAVTGLLLGVVLWYWGGSIADLIGIDAIRRYYWLVVAGTVGAGANSAFSYWAVREKRFGIISRTRVTRNASQVAVQLGGGVAGFGPLGLLLGDALGRVGGTWRIAAQFLEETPRNVGRAAMKRLVYAAVRYRRFPLLMAWATLLNVGSIQIPLLLISYYFGAAQLGLYALTHRVLTLPASLIGHAVGQVFLADASRVSGDPYRLAIFTRKVAITLYAVALPLMLVVGFAAPELFEMVFGASWRPAGQYAQILAPWFLLWFVSSPLSGLLIVRELQGSSVLFTSLELLMRVAAIAIGGKVGSVNGAVALLSVTGAGISLAAIARFARAASLPIVSLLGPVAKVTALNVPAALGLAAAVMVTDVQWVVGGVGVMALVCSYSLTAKNIRRLTWQSQSAHGEGHERTGSRSVLSA